MSSASPATPLATVLEWLPTPSEHFLISTLALIVYLVNARARRERRAPAAAIAWVMGLALLPYLMLPLYLIFGQRKLPLPPPRPAAGRQPIATDHWAPALLESLGLPPPAAAPVRFHTDGAQAAAALWEMMDGARDTLDVCTFLIGSDAFGRAVLARLAQRAQAGVRVRLMYDGLSAWHAPRPALRELAAAGAQIAVFRPLFALGRAAPRNLRNHRKLVIADGERLWAGGRNFAAEYFQGTADSPPWLDLSFDLSGPVAADAAWQFAQDWATAHAGSAPPRLCRVVPVCESGGAPAQFLPSGPDQPEDTAQLLLIDACFRATQRVLAITPYFVPDGALLAALRLAARRGVQVTLVLPARSNHPLADFVRQRPLRELAHAGATIRLLPVMSHAKAVVVDDTLALSGSINLDARSLLLNYEFALVFYGPQEIEWLAAWMTARAAEATPFTPEPPGLLRDIAEGALLAVAFQV
ncbi:MAG: phospholipase D-like domain-containing protein [Steroidobacteraceae bacterium]